MREVFAVLCFFASVVFLGLAVGLHQRNLPIFHPSINASTSNISASPSFQTPYDANFSVVVVPAGNTTWYRRELPAQFADSFQVCANVVSAAAVGNPRLCYGFVNEVPTVDSLTCSRLPVCVQPVQDWCYGGNATRVVRKPPALLWFGFEYDPGGPAGALLNVRVEEASSAGALEPCDAEPFRKSTILLGVFLAFCALMYLVILLIVLSICCWPHFIFWWYYFGQIPFLQQREREIRRDQYQIELRKDRQMPESIAIEREQSQLKRERGQMVPILLSGVGFGKRQVALRFARMYLDGMSETEKTVYRQLMRHKSLMLLKTVVARAKTFGYDLSPENIESAAELSNLTITMDSAELGEKEARKFLLLAKDDAIEKALNHQRDEIASYSLEHFERIFAKGYQPTDDDTLRLSIRRAVHETEFVHNGMHFRLIDADGQINERRKWIHMFQEVTAIMFVVDVDQYSSLGDNLETNYLQDSLHLFDDLVNNRWFATTAILLILNNIDNFRAKIRKGSSPLHDSFPNYQGSDTDPDAALDYITKMFLTTDQSGRKREIYSHQISRSNDNLAGVAGSVEDIFLTGHLTAMGY